MLGFKSESMEEASKKYKKLLQGSERENL